jgi:Protein of unknown function (DUF2892)
METFQHSQSCGAKSREVNVSDVERVVSLVVGGALIVRGLQKMDVLPLALAVIGAGLIFRGASGHCGLYHALGARKARSPSAENTPSEPTSDTPRMSDDEMVNEASLESFPASDAPAWNSSVATPMPARTPHVS